MAAIIRSYGQRIHDQRLAEVVVFLYKAARADSTRKSYSVGQRHWATFHRLHPNIAFFPFESESPGPVALSLCFFVGYLALRPRIRRYTTVRSYLCHVRALWRDAGCPDHLLCSPLLKIVMRGVRRALPAPYDAREAFVLPHYTPPSYYLNPPSGRWLIFKAAVTLGFHAMLRYGAFCQLTPGSLTVVLKDGAEWPVPRVPPCIFDSLQKQILGVVYSFTPKYSAASGRGSAYFCHICDVAPHLKPHCPVCVLLRLWSDGLFRYPTRPIFDPSFFSPAALSSFLAHVAGKGSVKKRNPFKPHSLRIGGHTFYTIHGMNADLRDYLARRAVSRCTQRYYRAAPASNFRAVRSFYRKLRIPEDAPRPGTQP